MGKELSKEEFKAILTFLTNEYAEITGRSKVEVLKELGWRINNKSPMPDEYKKKLRENLIEKYGDRLDSSEKMSLKMLIEIDEDERIK